MLALFHNKAVQSLSAWTGLATFVLTMLSRSVPEWFGTLSWPQSILAGFGLALAAALVLAIILAIGGFGFRLFFPIKVPPQFTGDNADDGLPACDPPSPPHDDSELRASIEDLNRRFGAFVAGHNGRITELTNQLEAAQKAIAPMLDAFNALQKLERAKFLLKQVPSTPDDPKRLLVPIDRMRSVPLEREVQQQIPGFDLDTAEAERERIKADPKYVILYEGEAERFGTPDNKRAWHMLKARNDAMRASLEELVHRLEMMAKPFTSQEGK